MSVLEHAVVRTAVNPISSPAVVRNDRMKKKKEEKKHAEVETYVLSADTEQMIERVRQAHQDTFPSLCQLGKYTTVTADTHASIHTAHSSLKFLSSHSRHLEASHPQVFENMSRSVPPLFIFQL